ncbi:uncharacterized protein BX664DRAFT_66331 [Halteromyces radiatus]|uniref:uncharacterized protein n=1 Tax=Halteromyces radiatus TaxID=101107 RepID=UPI0022209201|nr:uncharacterized protein BX664DRAFT_66331 [Halteromyces radiatus]KAI8096795.1 hypothetical protein BX664DRAFT_66331 [Halteromyces radiatus]
MEQPSHTITYTLEEKEYDTPYYSIRQNYPQQYQGTNIPLVIDNGSNQCRAGWANEGTPSMIFDNVVARYRDRKANVNVVTVGMDAQSDPSSRSSARSPFDGNVVCDFDRMETVLDYIFTVLGITTSTIEHPLVMTEPVCVPQYSRNLMSELLFECYNAPSVTYGIDALFSHYANGGENEDGIIVSSGHNSTHIIPTLQGKGILGKAKR